MNDIYLNIADLNKSDIIQHSDHPNGAVDCGSEVAVWLSKYISGNDDGNRLVFYPDTESIRNYRRKHLKLKETGFIVRLKYLMYCGLINVKFV